uniref:Uncharacterized protein n=1 Tax=Oryza glaberrima TaxID=4538 RepID=I1PAA0_ORYGL
MDPHPTPFAGKRRSVAAAPAKIAAPKPKSIASTRTKTTRKSPPAPPPPRPRRAFGTVRSSNAHDAPEKPPPLQKAPKVSPPPPQKPDKVSPPPAQKPSKVSPPPPQKSAKVSPPPAAKPPKLSPPNLAKATKPSRLAAKPPKKAAPGPELDPKPRKKAQRVSFQEDAAMSVAPGSGEKVKVSTDDAAGHTPMVAVRALEKRVSVVASAETPFFSAQNCSNCSLDPLEESTYWLAHIHLAESVGKHRVAAAFFQLAFECQAQPIHRIQSELRNYTVRHESASTLTTLFDELLLAHGGIPVNQPKFETDGFEVVDTPLTTDSDDKRLDSTTTQVDERCSECDCGGDIVDVAVPSIVKPLEEGMDQPSFERKLNDGFEFDDCEAVIVDKLVGGHSDLEKIVDVNGPSDSETMQSACRSSIDRLSLKGSPVVSGLSQRQLSSDSPLDKLSPSARSLSAKRLSSVSPLDKKSPFGSSSSKRLTSSCPSSKKSFSSKALSSKRMSSGNASAGVGDLNEVIADMEFDCPASDDQLELKEHGDSEVCLRVLFTLWSSAEMI